MKVPFVDLKAQYESIKDEISIVMQNVLNETAFIGGPYVEKFEKEFASFCKCNYAIGVGSGTSALWLALKCLGIKDGDEVITTPNTYIATAEAISFCGAKPVFVDVIEQTYNMNPELLVKAINYKTAAIIPVHLYGQTVDMNPIMEIAKRYNLLVIEDACQSHGAEYKGRPAGSIGDAGCFSFYPGKNIGAYGDAGAVVTNNPELAEKIRIYRDHGQTKKYHHEVLGWNTRLDGLQAAILSVKLKHLPKWNEARRANAELYNKMLRDIDGVITPFEAEFAKHVYHIYAIRTKKRDELMKALAEKEIYCGIHYPIPIHFQNAYKFLDHKKDSFPVTEKCVDEILSLPMFPELSKEQIKKISNEIKLYSTKK